MALLDDIQTRLVAAGVIDNDWSGFKSFMPDTPNRVIVIYETGGPPPEASMAIEYPNFQVQVRGEPYGYEAARTKAQAVIDALHAQEALIGASYVYCYAAGSGVIPLGYDDTRCPHLSINFRVMKQST